ncbi:unnamed protein product, partial [Pylaiella littoralis]
MASAARRTRSCSAKVSASTRERSCLTSAAKTSSELVIGNVVRDGDGVLQSKSVGQAGGVDLGLEIQVRGRRNRRITRRGGRSRNGSRSWRSNRRSDGCGSSEHWSGGDGSSGGGHSGGSRSLVHRDVGD